MTASSQPCDEVLREHAYLVERRVRLIAHVGSCAAEDAAIVRHRLAVIAAARVLPFVLDEGETAVVGFASHAWAVDLYQWARAEAPVVQRDRIAGLLLGYDGDAIRAFEELGITLGPTDREVSRGEVQP